MRHILQAATLEKVRLDMRKPAVDTCSKRRAWQQLQQDTMPLVSLPLELNEEGECDLLFYKRQMTSHIKDRAVKHASTCRIRDKKMHTLLDTYRTVWPQQRVTTTSRPRIQGQHARQRGSQIGVLRHDAYSIGNDLSRDETAYTL